MKETLILIGIVAILVLGAFGFHNLNKTGNIIGSSTVGNEYTLSTTTSGFTSASILLKNGYGALGSVNITSAITDSFILYDGTTTSPGADWNNRILASYPTSAAVGFQSYDVAFTKGLLLVQHKVLANLGSTTITYR